MVTARYKTRNALVPFGFLANSREGCRLWCVYKSKTINDIISF